MAEQNGEVIFRFSTEGFASVSANNEDVRISGVGKVSGEAMTSHAGGHDERGQIPHLVDDYCI